MKKLFLSLFLLLSLAVNAATTYTAVYDANGNLLGAMSSNGNTITNIQPGSTDPGLPAFNAWLAAQTPPISQSQWLAANPWQPWGSLTLAQYQAQQIAKLKTDCDALVLAHYPSTNLMALIKMKLDAVSATPPLPNRAAYLEQCWTWITAVTNLYYTQAAAISAATTCQQVQAVTWSTQLATIAGQDPNVTIAAAMAITN